MLFSQLEPFPLGPRIALGTHLFLDSTPIHFTMCREGTCCFS